MRVPKWLRFILIGLASLLGLVAVLVLAIRTYFHPKLTRTNGIVYGHRHGHDLLMDVLQPARPNGFGVVVMVSGGWKSGKPGSFPLFMATPLLRDGYTVFAAYHISQPESTVMEIVEDMNRSVRFVRYHAREYGVRPDRLGITGGSAGGHLSLMLATRGGAGNANASDPVERESSAVQAVAIFYPVTDLLNLGQSTENPGDGGPPKSFVKAFGPQSTNLAIWKVTGREMSPIYYVKSNLPPILIYHGDADTLVPLEQSERFQTEARKLGCTVEVVVHAGGKHGWLSMVWDLRRFAAWFDRYLMGDAKALAAKPVSEYQDTGEENPIQDGQCQKDLALVL